MTIESLPSKKVSIVDIPEVEQFGTQFIYNFFVADERVNENGSVPDKILERPSERFDVKYVDSIEFNRAVPRYVQLNWGPKNVGKRPDLISKISIEDNFKKIYYEDDFTFNDFIHLNIQETHADERIEFFLKKAVKAIENNIGTYQSTQDHAKKLNKASNPDISTEFIELGLNPASSDIKFFDKNGSQPIVNLLIEGVKNAKNSIQINTKVVADIIQNSAYNDVISPFSDELETLVGQTKVIQDTTQKTRDSSLISSDEYDFEIKNFILQKAVDTDGYESVLQTIGYLIEKEEIQSNGTIIPLTPIFVENSLISSTVDVKIKYGSTYRYKIRTVGYVELQAFDEIFGTVVAVGFLVASKPSIANVVNCEEFIPPPSPVDFDLRWDYKQSLLRLTWSFPVNSQQDIKKFQIFRRKELTHPYQLIKMYDFDDSVIKTPFNEMPDPALIETNRNPNLSFYDLEFKKDSKYMYTLASIDAHGMSSGYSIQFQISFDRVLNKLVKKLISVSGAPKAYPNAFINQDTFVDSIKDEHHSKLEIFFNPEYLRVYDNKKNDLGLLKTKPSDKYIFQFINLDLQSYENVEIQLADRTKNKFLSRPLKRTTDKSVNIPTVSKNRTGISKGSTNKLKSSKENK